MKEIITVILISFAAVSIAEKPEDSDGDGFTNLEEIKAGTDTRDNRSHPSLAEYALYVDKVEARGTNFWVHFLQFGRSPVWVREGTPDGPIGHMPDAGNRKLWKRISHVAVDNSVKTNINVVITFQDDGKTNKWSCLLYTSPSPRD